LLNCPSNLNYSLPLSLFLDLFKPGEPESSSVADVVYQNMRNLSTIIICRFHLDLQRQHAHPSTKTSWGLPTMSIGSFRMATQRVHDAVMAEFGDLQADAAYDMETSQDMVVPAAGAETTLLQ
jgi:hypothetical protein